MKPLYVLLLVLAALAALIVALGGLRSTNRPSITPTAGGSTPITGSGAGDPELLPTEERRGPGSVASEASPVADRETVDASGAEYRNSLSGLVIDPLKTPIPGAKVTLTGRTRENLFFQTQGGSNLPDVFTQTDEDGAFRFENIPPLEGYALIVSHPEYSTRRVGGLRVLAFGDKEEPPVVLDRGSLLRGSVRDVGGNAVPEAKVSIYPSTSFSAVPPKTGGRHTNTDANGTFSIDNVSAGLHWVLVEAEGYGTLRRNGVQIQNSREIELELTLKPAQLLGGRVLGTGDTPIEGALVVATALRRGDASQSRARTDEEGEFLLDDLNPGRYNLSIQHELHENASETRVKVGALDLVVRMVPLGVVSGQVVDANGKKVAKGEVRLRFASISGAANAPTTATNKTASIRRGEFLIAGVNKGDFLVEANVDGFAPTFSAPFRVTTSQEVAGVVIRLERGGSISGRLVDSEGTPVAGARIETHDNTWTDDPLTRAMGAQYPTNATTRYARSDDRGRFRLENLRPDLYQLRIEASGLCPRIQRNVLVSADDEKSLGEIKLTPGGGLQGSVYDASGERLVAAQVELVQKADPGEIGQRFKARSDLKGAYLFERIPPGVYELTGARPAGPNSSPLEQLFEKDLSKRQVVIREDETVRQDITIGG